MSRRNNRYNQMTTYMSYALLAAVLIFIIYLFAAGAGVIWLKATCAIRAILICVLCLAFLYLTKELLRPRSLWMSACALAITICTIFSLLLNFPSPAPPRYEGNPETVVATENT